MRAKSAVTGKAGFKTTLKVFCGKTRKGFLRLFTNEKRSRWFVPVFSILLSLIISILVLLVSGANPFEVFASLLKGAGIIPGSLGFENMLYSFFNMLCYLAPLMFAALAVCVAYKAGLFNIGVSGQMTFAGFMGYLIGQSALPPGLSQILTILVGTAGGMLIGGLIGFLKYKFNINEVVSSIMLNYIVMYLVTYFVVNFFFDGMNQTSLPTPSGSMLTISAKIGETAISIPFMILFAAGAVFCIWFLLKKTKLGFEIQAVGKNRKAAQYAGINVGKNIVFSMLVSGALAGLAGISYFMGTYRVVQPNQLVNMGFDSIAVSLLGASSPIGIIFSSLLISIMNTGARSLVGVKDEIVSIMIALMLLFAACGEFMKYLAARSQERSELKAKKAETDASANGGVPRENGAAEDAGEGGERVADDR